MSNSTTEERGIIIERKEFRRRYKEFMRECGEFLNKVFTITSEKEISFGTIIERDAEQYADKVAIKFEDTELTFKEYNELVNQYAHYFISLGLKKGDVVDILLHNRVEMLILIGAVGKIGAVGSLINSDLREKSLIHSFKTTLGKVIIIGEECLDSFEKVKDELNFTKDNLLYFLPDMKEVSCPEGYIDLSSAVKEFPVDNPSTTSEIKTFDNHLYIFTSGTTGLPKAAYFPHHRMIVGGIVMGQAMGRLTSEDTMYVSTPLFHSNSLAVGVSSVFATGGTLALARRFSASRFWDDVRKYKVTAFNYVGELCRYLMNQPPKPNDSDNPVRTMIGNGLRPEIWKKFKERFGIERVGEFYGTTEAFGGFNNILNFDCTCGYNSRTWAIVQYDITEDEVIRGEDGFMQKVGVGGDGLLLFPVIGDITFFGYTDNKATEAKYFHDVFKEGDIWINSGDLVRDQGCNHVMFVDRLGDTFRWKGHNISTTEVENTFSSYEQVSLSSVYGVKIPGTDGRAGMASFAPEINIEDFNFKGLANYLLENLPPYGVPIFLRVKSELATTSTFKIKKSLLKKEGFDLDIIDDALYVMLPHESNYVPLTKEIYEDIQTGNYKA
jgi:citronellyl-CoA synthetase